MNKLITGILVSSILITSQVPVLALESISDFRANTKILRAQIRTDIKTGTDLAPDLNRLRNLEDRINEFESEINYDLVRFYSDKTNREFLLRTKRIDNINKVVMSAVGLGLINNVGTDKIAHIYSTDCINDILNGITNEDRPFLSFMAMTLGKEIFWDKILKRGNFSALDILANSVIIPLKVDYKELYSDLSNLRPSRIHENGVKKTIKGFVINERKSPEGLRLIRAKYDNLYQAQMDLIKTQELIDKSDLTHI